MYRFESFAVQVHSQVLIRPHTLFLPKKGLLVVIGANGVGKTTFLKQVGNSFIKMNPKLKISFVSSIQMYEKGLPLTGKEFYRLFSKQNWPNLLQDLFGHLLDKRIDRMSSGEFQALVLISNFMEDSDVFLIDEPISHLSPEWSIFFTNWMDNLKQDKLLIAISHQIELLSAITDQIYEIKNQTLKKKIENNIEGPHGFV